VKNAYKEPERINTVTHHLTVLHVQVQLPIPWLFFKFLLAASFSFRILPMSTPFLEQYDALDVIGNGSFGIIRKVRRKADGIVSPLGTVVDLS
jgi:hypothetical protein